jgi:dCMP deaminase
MRKDKALKFLRQARFLADEFSKDNSTKVGANCVNPFDFTKLSEGYNGMVRGVNESIAERQIRPVKYFFYEHAERNLIYNLARRYLKGTIAVVSEYPDISSVRALLSVGVKEVVFYAPAAETAEVKIANQLFAETGVRVREATAGLLPEVAETQTELRHIRKLNALLQKARMLPAIMAKDPSGSATLFISPDDYTELSSGYSGMLRGLEDLDMSKYSGKQRATWVETSVRNAIFNTVRAELKGSTATVTATTCVECARAFASVGIAEIYYVQPSQDFYERWSESIEEALALLEAAGVKAHSIHPDELVAA